MFVGMRLLLRSNANHTHSFSIVVTSLQVPLRGGVGQVGCGEKSEGAGWCPVLGCAALAHGRGCCLCPRTRDRRKVVAPSGFNTRTGQRPERPPRKAPAFALETTGGARGDQVRPGPGGPAFLSSTCTPCLVFLQLPNLLGSLLGNTWLRSRETSRAGHPLLTPPGCLQSHRLTAMVRD